MKVQLEKFFIT